MYSHVIQYLRLTRQSKRKHQIYIVYDVKEAKLLGCAAEYCDIAHFLVIIELQLAAMSAQVRREWNAVLVHMTQIRVYSMLMLVNLM